MEAKIGDAERATARTEATKVIIVRGDFMVNRFNVLLLLLLELVRVQQII